MNQIDTNTLIAICTCAIGLTQFILWKHIAKVKAYESEKGKNLATKEDIGEITKEIKSVESKFINETEKLKAELNLLTNIKTGLISEKRNIIIDLHASLQKWIQATIYFDSTNLYQNDSIYRGIDSISNLHNDVLVKESMFKIYIENDNLRFYIYDVNKNGLNCMSLKTKLYFELIGVNDEMQLLKETKRASGIDILNSKRKDILDRYYTEQQQAADELFKIIAEFEEQCRTYITNYNTN